MPEIGGVFGRGRELGVVAAFLGGLRSGPSGLLLEGEAGIGKTTVWSVGVADAARHRAAGTIGRPLARRPPSEGCFWDDHAEGASREA